MFTVNYALHGIYVEMRLKCIILFDGQCAAVETMFQLFLHNVKNIVDKLVFL